jgi:hypothetical protein
LYHHDTEDISLGLPHYDTEDIPQGLHHHDTEDILYELHHDDIDRTYTGNTYRENNNVKKNPFALFVFIACIFVIAIGFAILFFLGGDILTGSDEDTPDVAHVIEEESDSDSALETTIEETADEPEPVIEETVEELEESPVAEDENDTDIVVVDDEEMTLIGIWEGSFVSRGGIAYDLIIGIDPNYQITATYFHADSRETVLARYYGVAHRRGIDEVIIEYTSSSITPEGWDEDGITLFGIISDRAISGFFEYEGTQSGTAILRMDAPPTTADAEQLYRIRITWDDYTSQIGAFANLSNAINATPEGYSVFDGLGNVVFRR